ncbi:hypothetical protein B0H14DRAFT_2644883 [Mycena olivaceomarginata]|nr:hypothetical protein B0H14DRAFT_2644883 [Mycena olivaceomarginata]
MPGLDLRGRKVGGFRYFSSFVAAPDFATVAPQKIHVPGGKNNITGNHSQMGKRPEGGMRPERAAGRKKRGEAGTSGACHAVLVGGKSWWKTVERGTATLQAYNVLQCWWLVREIIPRKTNPAGVQRLAALVVGQRRTTSCSVGGWSEGNAEKLRKIFQKLLHSITTSRRQNRTQDALNGPSPRSYDRVAHRHISVTTQCVTTRTRTTITARRSSQNSLTSDQPPTLQDVIQKTDENIQIRAYSYLQSKKTPQRTPPLRRGTRASLDPVRNSGTRTIEIPLDPILVTSRAYVNKISGLAGMIDFLTKTLWIVIRLTCGRRKQRSVGVGPAGGGRQRGRMWRTKAWARADQDDAREGDGPTKTTCGGYNRPTKTTSGLGRAPTKMMRGWGVDKDDGQAGPRADNGDERVEMRADKAAKTWGRMRAGHSTKGVDKDDGQAGPRADNGDERVGLRADKDAKTGGRMRTGHNTKGDVGAGHSPDNAEARGGMVARQRRRAGGVGRRQRRRAGGPSCGQWRRAGGDACRQSRKDVGANAGRPQHKGAAIVAIQGVDKDDGQAGPRADNGDERVEMRADKAAKTWGRMRAGHSTKVRPCGDPGDVGAGHSPDNAEARGGWSPDKDDERVGLGRRQRRRAGGPSCGQWRRAGGDACRQRRKDVGANAGRPQHKGAAMWRSR